MSNLLMKFEGCPGNATAEGYKDYIQIQSAQLGVARGISMEAGNLANREASKASLTDAVITLETDVSIIPLFKEACAGVVGKKVEIVTLQTGSGEPVAYHTVTLSDTLVSSWSFSVDAGGKGFITCALSYGMIDQCYSNYDKGNKVVSPIRCGYDVAAARPL